MANKAFDKHVEFCEEYMKEIHNILHELYSDTESFKQIKQANDLYRLREDYAVWLTNEINEDLEKFEVALRRLGVDAHFINSTAGSNNYANQRTMKIESSYELFNEILGIDKDKELNEDYAIESIKRKVKEILDIKELTGLRKHLVHEASKVLQNGT